MTVIRGGLRLGALFPGMLGKKKIQLDNGSELDLVEDDLHGPRGDDQGHRRAHRRRGWRRRAGADSLRVASAIVCLELRARLLLICSAYYGCWTCLLRVGRGEIRRFDRNRIGNRRRRGDARRVEIDDVLRANRMGQRQSAQHEDQSDTRVASHDGSRLADRKSVIRKLGLELPKRYRRGSDEDAA